MKLLEMIPAVIMLLFVATVRGQTTQSPSASPSNYPSSSVSPSTAPSDSPSEVPSSAPSVTPTKAPSDQPTGLPTSAPSAEPSFAPSFDPELPPNDRCSRAFEIAVDGPSEGWFNFKSSIGSRCRSPSESGPSVWYRFVGTGDWVNLMLCDNDDDRDSGINIHKSRTGDCEDAKCGLNTRFTQSSCGNGGGPGTTSIRSRAGEVYFIEVMTFGEDNPGTTGLLRVARA
jgi:hypothetical protein